MKHLLTTAALIALTATAAYGGSLHIRQSDIPLEEHSRQSDPREYQANSSQDKQAEFFALAKQCSAAQSIEEAKKIGEQLSEQRSSILESEHDADFADRSYTELDWCRIHAERLGSKARQERAEEKRRLRREAGLERQMAETERQLRVFSEAYEACLALDAKDPIAARTNALCHELFVANKYK